MKLVITGHRPDKMGGYEKGFLKFAVSLAMDKIRDKMPTVVIAGMALGWDLACAIATIKLRDEEEMPVELWAYVPFQGQEESKWKDAWMVEYQKALAKANHVVYVNDAVPADKGQAVRWLQERNERMIDDGDKVLALHNGTKGGTYNCIQYANKMGRPVHNVWPQWAVLMGFTKR